MFRIIFKILRFLRLGLLAMTLLTAAFFLYVPYKIWENKEKISEETIKPNLITDFIGEKKEIYNWKYNDISYSLSVSLYQSVYDFYTNKPKTFEYSSENPPASWKEKYYDMFLVPAENDDTFKKVAFEIKKLGQNKRLSEDQIAELALAFVQAIPYDDEKATLILNASKESVDPQILPRYPYETLYEKKGVCSDKSFLAYILLKNLGYGVSLFEFPQANHMSIGIKCPSQYSLANSGYCYAETTNIGHRIGLVPELDENRKALVKKELSYFTESEGFSSAINLENPQIFEKTEGKSYELIASTFQVQNNIAKTEKLLASLRTQLENLKNQIESAEKELKNLSDKLNHYKKTDQYEKYNNLVDDYNDLVKKYKKLVDQYNTKVNEYNRNVNYYNKLLKDFSILE